MNLETATKEQRLYVEKQVALGHGEIVTIKYTDLEPAEKGAEGEGVFTVGGKKFRRAEKTRQYYVGRMSAGVTGGVLAVLGVLFLRGSNLKEIEGSTHNLAFLEVLDEQHLSLLVAMALGGGDEQEFVQDNFDLVGWVTDVLIVFFRYNRFFDLVGKFGTFLQTMGVTEEQARNMAMGKATA